MARFERLAAFALTTMLAIGLLTGCASNADPDSADSHPSADNSSFPVSIDHIFGTTTIAEKPERIVTLGVSDADVVLALGSVPVGNTGFSFYATGLGPWTDSLVGDAPLTLVKSDSTPDLEQIAGLDPDLIIGVSAGFDQATYDQLSRIAPTVARPAGSAAYAVGREDATNLIATALGQAARGAELNQQTSALLTSTVSAHPEFSGKTGVAILPYQGQYGAFLPGDARGQFLTSLGFRVPDTITSQDTGTSFFVPVSSENVSLLDSDVLLVLGADENVDVVAQNPLFGALTSGRNGAIIATALDQRGAITYNSVLSIPYAVDTLVPRIAHALGRG